MSLFCDPDEVLMVFSFWVFHSVCLFCLVSEPERVSMENCFYLLYFNGIWEMCHSAVASPSPSPDFSSFEKGYFFFFFFMFGFSISVGRLCSYNTLVQLNWDCVYNLTSRVLSLSC